MSDQIFSITDLQDVDGRITANLHINAASNILKGHFPDQPVVPGACLVQTVKDVLEDVLKAELMLSGAGTIKFISMITPEGSPISQLTIDRKPAEEDGVSVTAQVTANGAACFKMQGKYVKR